MMQPEANAAAAAAIPDDRNVMELHRALARRKVEAERMEKTLEEVRMELVTGWQQHDELRDENAALTKDNEALRASNAALGALRAAEAERDAAETAHEAATSRLERARAERKRAHAALANGEARV